MKAAVTDITKPAPDVDLLTSTASLPRDIDSLIVQETGVFRQASVAKSAQEQMLTNPDMMTDMLKKNLGGIVPQVSKLQHILQIRG